MTIRNCQEIYEARFECLVSVFCPRQKGIQAPLKNDFLLISFFN
jgi:hypothetical protein